MTRADELRERLRASQERLARVLAGVTEEQFKRRPPALPDDPDPWCIAEVLAHVLANERLWAARIAQALAADGSTIEPSPPEAHDQGARAGRHVPVPQLIHGLLGARHQTERLLTAARDEAGGLRGNALWHPRLQERLNLAWMFEKIASHQEEHIAHIAALRELAGARPLVEGGAR